MPAPAYTETEAAFHELGHAFVAAAIKVPFQFVEIRPAAAPRTGSGGQCLLVAVPARRIDCDAFQLGGPLLQMQCASASVGPHLALFQPSLFKHTKRLMDPNDLFPVANDYLHWGSDLYLSGMAHQMGGWSAGWMRKFGGDKPWVPNLEALVISLFALPEIQTVAGTLAAELVQQRKLPAKHVVDQFNAAAPANSCEALRKYIAAQPA